MKADAVAVNDLDKLAGATPQTMLKVSKSKHSSPQAKSQPIILQIQGKITRFNFKDPKTDKTIHGWSLEAESKAGPNAIDGSTAGYGYPCYTKDEAEERFDKLIERAKIRLSKQNVPRPVKLRVKLTVEGKEVPYTPQFKPQDLDKLEPVQSASPIEVSGGLGS